MAPLSLFCHQAAPHPTPLSSPLRGPAEPPLWSCLAFKHSLGTSLLFTLTPPTDTGHSTCCLFVPIPTHLALSEPQRAGPTLGHSECSYVALVPWQGREAHPWHSGCCFPCVPIRRQCLGSKHCSPSPLTVAAGPGPNAGQSRAEQLGGKLRPLPALAWDSR